MEVLLSTGIPRLGLYDIVIFYIFLTQKLYIYKTRGIGKVVYFEKGMSSLVLISILSGLSYGPMQVLVKVA